VTDLGTTTERDLTPPCPQCAGVGAIFGVTASSGKRAVEYVCEGCGHRFDVEYPDATDFLQEKPPSTD
jgi:predicted RNA-binding Zn-ribbon protein involved in translation (DUF1610 family)